MPKSPRKNLNRKYGNHSWTPKDAVYEIASDQPVLEFCSTFKRNGHIEMSQKVCQCGVIRIQLRGTNGKRPFETLYIDKNKSTVIEPPCRLEMDRID